MLYFAAPLALWLLLRLVEPQRSYSRLYLAAALSLIYFTSEMVAGIGLWLIVLACLADTERSRRSKVALTIVLAPLIAFTHPGIAPPPPTERTSAHIYFKWLAAPNYVRDIVLPDYGSRRMGFAFYTFFRSNRRAVLYRPLDRRGEWIPFECAPVDRALTRARDEIDRQFLAFLSKNYCVR